MIRMGGVYGKGRTSGIIGRVGKHESKKIKNINFGMGGVDIKGRVRRGLGGVDENIVSYRGSGNINTSSVI